MTKKILPNIRNRKRVKLSLLASFIVALSIPLAVWTLATGTNFDSRNFAQNLQDALQDPNICKYRFTYVNGGTVEKDSIVQLEIDAQTNESNISSLIVKDISSDKEQILFSKEYKDVELKAVSEYFIYKAKEEGNKIFLGEMRYGEPETTRVCEYDPVLQADDIRVAPSNQAPVFTTNPYEQSDPSTSIKVGDSYRYTLKAEDADSDRIYYQSSFTPRADWLNYTTERDGSGGQLQLNYQGIADTPESYLVNVFVHDGYNNHLRSQSWVINVDPKENDLPVVKILSKFADQTFRRGSVITVKWEASDQNLLNLFKIFYATNPGDQTTWRLVDGNIHHSVVEYSLDTTGIPEGKYSIIVQAEDNQNPTGIGTAVEGPFEIIPTNPPIQPANPDDAPEDNTPDDGDMFDDPQILNIEPSDRSEVRDPRKSIKATLISGKDSDVIKDSIKFELDGEDLTEELELKVKNNGEINVIYTPVKDLEEGEHSITLSFTDTKERDALKEWSFTLLGDKSEEIIKPFGIEMTKRTATILGIGILIVLLALVVPWLLYIAWKNSDDEDEPRKSPYDLPPVQPHSPVEATRNVNSNTVITPAKVESEEEKTKPVLPMRDFNTALDPQIVAISESENNKQPLSSTHEDKVTNNYEQNSTSLPTPEKSNVTTFNDITINQDKNIYPQRTDQPSPQTVIPVQQSHETTVPTSPLSKSLVDNSPTPVNNSQPVNSSDIPEYKDMTMSSLESLAQTIEEQNENNPYNFLNKEGEQTNAPKQPTDPAAPPEDNSIKNQ